MHSLSGRPFVNAIFMACFSCIFVSSLAGGKMIVCLHYILVSQCTVQKHKINNTSCTRENNSHVETFAVLNQQKIAAS